MTIPSTTARMDYTGNGATSVYSYTFKVFAKTDLKVVKRDTSDLETVLVVDTDYTVSGVGESAGGSITLAAGNLPSGYKLTIRRARALTQETDIRNQGDFYPEIHEDAFDDLVMKDQTQQSIIDRALRIPETVTGVSVTLPVPVALKWPRWNAAGTALENVDAASLGSITTIGAGLQLVSGDLSEIRPTLVGTAGGTVNAITCTVSPAPAALSNGLRVLARATGANSSATPTFNLNSLGAKTIVKGSNAALLAGDIAGAGFWVDLAYDSTLDKWVLQNPFDAITLVEHNNDGTHNFGEVMLTRTAAQAISNATLTPIIWDSETKDTGGFHDNVTSDTTRSKIVVPAGYRMMDMVAQTLWVVSTVGTRFLKIVRGGPSDIAMDEKSAVGTTGYGACQVQVIGLPVSAGQEFFIDVYQSSGGPLNLDAQSWVSARFWR